jgi:hypothetical protein
MSRVRGSAALAEVLLEELERRARALCGPGVFLAAQLDPADLARDGLRQIAELDPTHQLVAGHSLAHEPGTDLH